MLLHQALINRASELTNEVIEDMTKSMPNWGKMLNNLREIKHILEENTNDCIVCKEIIKGYEDEQKRID